MEFRASAPRAAGRRIGAFSLSATPERASGSSPHAGRAPHAGRGRKRKVSPPVSRVLFPASAGEAGALWGGSHPSRSPVTRRLQRPYPRTDRASRIVLLFGLAPGGVYRASRSPGCWWALTRTISPSPSLPRRLCLFCGTLLRVTPTGCYPAPCSVELGLSSTGRSRRDCLADSPAILPRCSAGTTQRTSPPAKTMTPAAARKATVKLT